MTTPWLVKPQANSQANLRLFCFPYAGAGASVFRSWSSQLPQDIEVYSVQLPGRENRLKEPLLTNVTSVIQALTPVLLPYLDRPFVFFGHSLGALICFALTRQLRRMSSPMPLQLFVSARRAPQIPDIESPMHLLPDAEFIEKLKHYNGTPQGVLENVELMNLFLPILRADFAINETYDYKPETPLDCPISVFGGLEDGRVTREALAAWQEQTNSERFTLRMLPGDHFFLKSQQDQLLSAIFQDARLLF